MIGASCYVAGNGCGPGSAYVFVRAGNGTWMQQAKLLASDGAEGYWFGSRLAVSGNTAVISAPGDDDNGDDSGSAYVFVRAADGTWTEQAKLLASDGAALDRFGHGVAVSGDTAVIGAYLDDDKGSDSGSAYVFTRCPICGRWSQQAKLLAQDGAEGDHFGLSVGLSGDTAVIGNHLDDDKGTDSGSAYVFVRAAGTWTQQDKLLASDGAAHDSFGHSVAVSGDTAVIGSPWDGGSGSSYVFVRAAGTWTQQQAKLLASDGAFGDYFGGSVALSGDTAVIGAIGNHAYGSDSGAAYVFGSSARPLTNLMPVYELLLLKRR